MNLPDYNYFLPEKNLALEPAVPRDSSKLLIYDTTEDKIIFDHFYNLDKYLPKNSFMVLNNTKVLPARVTMTRLRPDFAKATTGKQGYGGQGKGKVVLLFLINELTNSRIVKVLADRKIVVGDKVYFDDKYSLKVVGQNENIFELQFSFNQEHLFDLLEKYGNMPIPPYLKKSTLSKDDLLKKYQTIFAKTDGSAAAPTASLHFTDSVFKKLDEKKIGRAFITLHVGMGTFAPITNENIKQKKLHNEFYEVDPRTYQSINRLIQEGKKLVAVGTTVVRTLESIAQQQKQLSSLFNSQFSIHNSKLINKTDLFIFPPYDFKLVDIMITNFHLPKSSLMMLVEAFLQFKNSKRSLVELYEIAIKNDFRFYSFGDAMLII